jgi:hypothetical protein
MHEQVDKVEEAIVKPCVSVDNESESTPCETGYLSGDSNEHDELVEVGFQVISFELLSVKISQPHTGRYYHWNYVPMILLLSHLTSIVQRVKVNMQV